MHVDECGAPERLAGIKLLTVPTDGRQADPGDVRRWEERPRRRAPGTAAGRLDHPGHRARHRLHARGDRARSPTPPTSSGCTCTSTARGSPTPPRRSTCRSRALTTEPASTSSPSAAPRTGSCSATRSSSCAPELAEAFRFTRKQLGQLASKMRFLAVQFDALLGGDLWRANASHANAMARRLAEAVSKLDGVRIAHPVEANGVFVTLPARAIDRLRDALPASLPFYVWDEAAGTIRLMCSWDTTDEDVDGLATALAEALSRGPGQSRGPAPRLRALSRHRRGPGRDRAIRSSCGTCPPSAPGRSARPYEETEGMRQSLDHLGTSAWRHRRLEVEERTQPVTRSSPSSASGGARRKPGCRSTCTSAQVGPIATESSSGWTCTRRPRRRCGPPVSPRATSAAPLVESPPRRYREPPARIAQLVEHLHGKEGVVGSSPTPGFSWSEPRRPRKGTAMEKSGSQKSKSPSAADRREDQGVWATGAARCSAGCAPWSRKPTPEVVEEWKWRGVPVWSHDGIICTGETYKRS